MKKVRRYMKSGTNSKQWPRENPCEATSYLKERNPKVLAWMNWNVAVLFRRLYKRSCLNLYSNIILPAFQWVVNISPPFTTKKKKNALSSFSIIDLQFGLEPTGFDLVNGHPSGENIFWNRSYFLEIFPKWMKTSFTLLQILKSRHVY